MSVIWFLVAAAACGIVYVAYKYPDFFKKKADEVVDKIDDLKN